MKKLFKYFIFAIFFAYYFVALFINIPWINSHLKPLELFNAKKTVQVNQNIYLGVYPNREDLINLRDKKGIKRVITLLNPDMPISRELVKAEQKECNELGLELIIIPISYFSKNVMDYIIIKNFQNQKVKTYIHSYYFDTRMSIVGRVLKS